MINQLITERFTTLSAQLPLAGFWFRESASHATSDKIDWIFDAILWISVFFFVLIMGVMVAFVAKYYARPGRVAEHTAHHSNSLEAFWSIIPSIIVLWIFAVGFINYLDLRTPPEGAYEVQVIAKKWSWSFIYPTGHVDANLHVPLGKPVKLTMSSDDVIHSLFIPAFRVKMDCVPGRYSTLWFKADKATESFEPTLEAKDTLGDQNGFDLFCTEYCGQGHSAMIAKVIVHESGAFDPWMEKAMTWEDTESPVERGALLYKQRGCAQCHSLDGRSGTGPSFKDTFGTKQATSTGEVTVDDNYLRESMLNPMAKIRNGFKGVMPSFQGQLKDHEIAALIWFIKSQNADSGITIPDTWADAGGVPGQEAKQEEEAAEEPVSEETPAVEEPAEEAKPAETEPTAESETTEEAAAETPAEPEAPAETEQPAETETPAEEAEAAN